jgi:hypothetical protein
VQKKHRFLIVLLGSGLSGLGLSIVIPIMKNEFFIHTGRRVARLVDFFGESFVVRHFVAFSPICVTHDPFE